MSGTTGLGEYKKDEEEREFTKAVATGLMEVRAGAELDLDDVKKKLGIVISNSAYGDPER